MDSFFATSTYSKRLTMKIVSVLKLRKGAWSSDEDTLLRQCIQKYGEGKWNLVPHRAGVFLRSPTGILNLSYSHRMIYRNADRQ